MAFGAVRVIGGTALCSLAAGCGRGAPYEIGVVLDPSGLEGAKLAVARVNAQGGVKGHRVMLRNVGGASVGTAGVALATAERLAANPAVLAVIGHTNSASSLAASQVYNARHLVQVAPTSTTPLYSRAGPYSFRLVGSDLHQASFLAARAVADGARRRVAVLYVNNDYGRPLHTLLLDGLRKAGVSPVYDAPFSTTNPGDKEIGMSMSESRPDLLIFVGRADEFASIVRPVRSTLPRIEVLASDAFASATIANDTTHLFDDVRYVGLVNVERPDSALQRIRADRSKAGKGEIGVQELLAYDAVMLIAEAIRNAGPDRESIQAWLSKLGHGLPPYVGLSGSISFPSGGDREPQYFLERVGARASGSR